MPLDTKAIREHMAGYDVSPNPPPHQGCIGSVWRQTIIGLCDRLDAAEEALAAAVGERPRVKVENHPVRADEGRGRGQRGSEAGCYG